MWTLVKDICNMAEEMWIFWVPGLIVGILAGYFLAFSPLMIVIGIFGLLAALTTGDTLTVGAGGFLSFFSALALIGFLIGAIGVAMLVGTIPIVSVLPSIDINWRALFR